MISKNLGAISQVKEQLPRPAAGAFEILGDGLDGHIGVVSLVENVRRDIMDLVAMFTNEAHDIATRQLLDLDVKLEGPRDPKLHIWAFERTKPVHFMGLTVADTKQRSRLAS